MFARKINIEQDKRQKKKKTKLQKLKEKNRKCFVCLLLKQICLKINNKHKQKTKKDKTMKMKRKRKKKKIIFFRHTFRKLVIKSPFHFKAFSTFEKL